MLVFSTLQQLIHHMQHSSLTVSASVLLWPLPTLPEADPIGPVKYFDVEKIQRAACVQQQSTIGSCICKGALFTCKLSYTVEQNTFLFSLNRLCDRLPSALACSVLLLSEERSGSVSWLPSVMLRKSCAGMHDHWALLLQARGVSELGGPTDGRSQTQSLNGTSTRSSRQSKIPSSWRS